jgi:hypothetical protein
VSGRDVDPDRAERLIARLAPKGYDRARRTFRPWWRFARYDVRLRPGRGVAHVVGTRIVVAYAPGDCPHNVVHAFFHEVGHVQMLWLDVVVGAQFVTLSIEYAWWAAIVAFAAWTLVWREITAEIYVVSRLGWRNMWRGYTHLFRKVGRAAPPARGTS